LVRNSGIFGILPFEKDKIEFWWYDFFERYHLKSRIAFSAVMTFLEIPLENSQVDLEW